MRIAVVKDAISQVYDDDAEKIQKHFHYSLNPKYIHSYKKISYHYAVSDRPDSPYAVLAEQD